MSSLNSMMQKLHPLGIYSLDGGSNTLRELAAYAEGLDPLFDSLNEMEREAFVATAETYGLSEREKFIEHEKPQLPVARRRELLTGAEHCLNTDATARGFNQFLSDCGLQNFRVDETPSRYHVSIFINDTLTEGEKSLIGGKIAMAVPSHLNVTVYYKDGSSESH